MPLFVTQEMAILMKFLGDASGAMRAMDQVEGGLKKAGKTMTKMGGAVTGLAVGLGGLIFKLGSTGSSILAMRGEFDKMAAAYEIDGQKLLDTLDRVAGGTVKDTELMQKANMALLLGGKELAEALPMLMGIAAEKARALGMPITQAFEDIVRGVGRASPMILDNLGIIVDNTAAQKKLALELGYVKEAEGDVTEEIERQNLVLVKLSDQLELAKLKVAELTGEEKESVRVAAERKVIRLDEQIARETEAMAELTAQRVEGAPAAVADTKRLTKEEKTIALINAITEKYGETVDIVGEKKLTAAEQTQVMTTQIANLKDELSVAFVPALQKVLEWLEPFIEKLGQIPPETLAKIAGITLAITGLAAVLGPILMVLGSFMTVMSALPAVVGAVGVALTLLTGPVGIVLAIIAALYLAWKNNFLRIRDITGMVVTVVGEFLASLTGPIRTLLDWVNRLLGPLKSLLGMGGGGGVFKVEKMQKRGMISKPTLALLGEAGPERVVSARGRDGGMRAVTIHNYWDASISAKDRQELAEMMELTTYSAIRRVFV